MYQGKHSRQAVLAERRRSRMRRKTAVIASVALVGVLGVGGTIAWLTDDSGPVTNTFQPTEVTCLVEETFEGDVKSNVTVRNTGDVKAFIRAEVVANWVKVDENGKVTSVYGKAPVAGRDYAIDYILSEGWKVGADGYYYYDKAVAPGDPTKPLIRECTQILEGPAGCKLSVEILCSAIQADGVGSDGKRPAEMWSNEKVTVSVSGDALSIKNA